MRGYLGVIVGIGMLGLSAQGLALPASQRLTPDLYVDTQFALTNHLSKLVASHDQGTFLSYGAGTFAGSESNLEFFMSRQSESSRFALNQSSIETTWQDTAIRYHFGYFYAAGIFTQVASRVNSQGTELIDAAGSGMGAGLGMRMAVGRGGSFHLDLAGVSVSSMKNALDGEVSMPQRIDADLGGSLDLTSRMLDLVFGYRLRLTSIKTDAVYADSSYQTYVGLRFSFFF